MSHKSCFICVFYELPKQGITSGSCGYPVPEWLRMGAVSPFISTPDHTGQQCVTFKSKVDLISETVRDNNNE